MYELLLIATLDIDLKMNVVRYSSSGRSHSVFVGFQAKKLTRSFSTEPLTLR